MANKRASDIRRPFNNSVLSIIQVSGQHKRRACSLKYMRLLLTVMCSQLSSVWNRDVWLWFRCGVSVEGEETELLLVCGTWCAVRRWRRRRRGVREQSCDVGLSAEGTDTTPSRDTRNLPAKFHNGSLAPFKRKQWFERRSFMQRKKLKMHILFC